MSLSLGQASSLHNRVSSKHSEHWFPLFKQVLRRFCVPPPHDLEHVSQSKSDTLNRLIRINDDILPLQELRCVDWPEQTISGHGSSSRSDPIHNLPLFFGIGFVHVRFLDRNDFPHVFGHPLHSLQGDQSPFTKTSIHNPSWKLQWSSDFTLTLSNFNIQSLTCSSIDSWCWLCTCSCTTLTFFTCDLFTCKPWWPRCPTTIHWINKSDQNFPCWINTYLLCSKSDMSMNESGIMSRTFLYIEYIVVDYYPMYNRDPWRININYCCSVDHNDQQEVSILMFVWLERSLSKIIRRI